MMQQNLRSTSRRRRRRTLVHFVFFIQGKNIFAVCCVYACFNDHNFHLIHFAEIPARRLKLIIGGLAALALISIIVAIAVILSAKRKSHSKDEDIEAAVMLKRYSYDTVTKMTKSFTHALGEGGFETVFKGKLPDATGRDIALKILNESKGNGEDFIKELASMSRASHVNIVSLFGFCYEGSKRAIIYDFMPNGSLDKFISANMSTKMNWNTLYNIAVGVARGLEYLHNSCVPKIVHFDINIGSINLLNVIQPPECYSIMNK
ncbi:PR5-like receptor kinase [Brassica rapa]|uniref:Protein kinase domain-containing protein n=1 Tax=Brassica campestris TaxID=3711 RepID=M4DWX0_BRACM|nr:PR5-like receptor kinase [Brassica rapa]